jgi:aspartate/methionine/tyrosine aminotransferase
MRIGGRMAAVQTPVIPIVGRLVREHPGTISLGQGMVHFPAPAEAAAAVQNAAARKVLDAYGPVEGIPQLKDAIARKLEAENGVRLGTDRVVVVSAGANMAFLNVALAVTAPGDEIVLLAPFYFNHEMAVAIAGCRPVVVSTDRRYQPEPDRIAAAITPRTRAVVTISPNNPTGAVYPAGTLSEINRLCARHGIYHIHDEAYEYFTYGGARHFSPASLSGSEEHTISLFSLSKSFGFAGWRVGWAVLPAGLATAVAKIQDTNLICPPLASQHAALGAMRAGRSYSEPRIAELAAVRELVRTELRSLGDLCELSDGDGAFYFFARLRSRRDPLQLVERLVREFRVAVIPGTAFGVTDACSIRISYGGLTADAVGDGIGRLIEGLRHLLGGGE